MNTKVNKNRKLTREERIARLYRIDRIKIKIGSCVMNITGACILTAILLGIIYLIGTFLNWIEQSTFRTIIYFLVSGIIIVKWIASEIEIQEPQTKGKRYK